MNTDPSPATAEPASTTRRNFVLVYAALMVAMLLGSLDQTIFSTALPTIVGELHGVQHMAWVTTAYILAATIVMPLYGKLGDLLGRRNIFIAAIGLFTVGSLVAGSAQNMTMLIAGRAVQGLGGGGLMILSQSIIADLVPARERGKYMAPMGAVFGVSAIIGPILGGWFTDQHTWRWALLMNVPLGILAIGIAVYALHLRRPTGPVTIDRLGSGLLMAATTCTVLVATWGGTQYAWASLTIISLGVCAVAAWIAFFVVERRAPEPVIPPHLFHNRTFVVTTLVALVTIGIGMFAIVGYMPTYLQMVYGVSATRSGLLLLPLMGGLIATASLSGSIISRTGRLKPLVVAGAATLVLAVWLLSTLDVDTRLWVVCIYLGIAGAGLGLLVQNLVLAAQNEFSASQVGTVTSSNNFFREVGASLGTAVIGSVFANRLTEHLTTSVSANDAQRLGDVHSLTPAFVRALPAGLREIVVHSYADSLLPMFGWLVPVFVLGLIMTSFLSNAPVQGVGDRHDEPSTDEAVMAQTPRPQ